MFLGHGPSSQKQKKQQNKPAKARMVEEDSTHLGQFFSALRSSSKWLLRLYYKLDIGKSMPGIRGVAFSLHRIAIFQDHLLLQHGDPKILASTAICHLPEFLDSWFEPLSFLVGGWAYPSEKYEFVSESHKIHVPNHQPALNFDVELNAARANSGVTNITEEWLWMFTNSVV